MRITKKLFMMEIAELAAQRSTCKRLHVGAVITDSDMKTILAYGYNGNYAGGPNTCDSNEEGKCGCIHGEMNALTKPRAHKGDEYMFITQTPCLMCSKSIINAGIKKVFYRYKYRNPEGIDLLAKVGIELEQIKGQKNED